MSRDWNNLFWSEMTWWERSQAALAFMVALVISLAGAVGVIMVLGMVVETQTQRVADRERCLKAATNGYEIERCR